jgi:hypothetical protein
LNTKKLLTAALAAGMLTFGASAAVTPAPASAHTPEVSATCSTLTVKLTNYAPATDGNFVNSVSVTIDKTATQTIGFGASLTKSYTLGDKTVAHSYVVTVDADDDNYDRTFPTGTSVPCDAPPVVSDATAVLTTNPATCDTNGTLVLGGVKNATWGTPTRTAGPGAYSVTATAAKSHAFADGKTTRTFTGTLEGTLPADKAPCVTVVVVPERPAPTKASADETALDCDSLTQTTTTTTTTTDWVLDEDTNAWVPAPAVITTTSATTPIEATDCPTPPAVTPPTTPETPTTVTPPTTPSTPAVVTEQPTEPVLASTGFDAGTIVPIGALLLLSGAALALGRRFTAKRADRN